MFSLRPARSCVALRSLGVDRLFSGKAKGARPAVFNRLAEDNKHKQHVPGTCPDYDDLDAGTLPPKRVSSAQPPAHPSTQSSTLPPARPSPIQSPAEPPTPPRAALPPPPSATTGNPPADSVFRYNVMIFQWVVFASGRQGRPKQTVSTPAGRLTTTAQAPHLDECPFCLGNESMTPTTLFQLPHPPPGDDGDASPWELRVVPNKYPAVSAMVDRLAAAACGGGGGDGDGEGGSGGGGRVTMDEWYRPAGYSNNAFSDPEGRLSGDTPCVTTEIPAHGHHEVVVEGPSHNQPLATRDGEARVRRLLEAWHTRAAALTEDSLIEHIMYFKNQGGIAGASLMHPHSQIVGVPFVPRNVKSAQRRHHEVRSKGTPH